MKQTVIISTVVSVAVLVIAIAVNNSRVKKGKPSLFK